MFLFTLFLPQCLLGTLRLLIQPILHRTVSMVKYGYFMKFLSYIRWRAGSAITFRPCPGDHRMLSSDLAREPMISRAWSIRSPCSCRSMAIWRFAWAFWYFQPPRLRLLASLMRFCLGAAKGMKTHIILMMSQHCELHLNYAYFKSISNKMRFGK